MGSEYNSANQFPVNQEIEIGIVRYALVMTEIAKKNYYSCEISFNFQFFSILCMILFSSTGVLMAHNPLPHTPSHLPVEFGPEYTDFNYNFRFVSLQQHNQQAASSPIQTQQPALQILTSFLQPVY